MGYRSENGKILSLFVPERSERNVYKSENEQHFQQVLFRLKEKGMVIIMKKVCMIVQDPNVKGGVAAVTSGYRGSILEEYFSIKYVESYRDGTRIQKMLKALSGYLHFLWTLFVFKPQIVHIHSSFGPSFYRKLPYIYLSSTLGIPIINHIHGSELKKFYYDASKQKQKLIKKAWQKCDKIIALSESWKDELSNIIHEEKIEVINNYAKPSNSKCEYTLCNRILFMGLINQMKGCYDIVKVANQVRQRFPQCRFVIAGVGESDELLKYSKKYGVQEILEFPGWIGEDEKNKLLLVSDVFFLPSYSEGMPMSILEAMGFGLPIVSTNVGGIGKLVIDDYNGFLCEPGNIACFSESICKLLENERLRTEFGTNSASIIANDFSLKAHIDKLRKVYMELGG